MATITQATTVETIKSGSTMRYKFRYVLSTGEIHERRAWVALSVDQAQERDRRGVLLLDELARDEADRLLRD